jgi:hypothetical protein
MTDEPDKVGRARQSVTAALLVALLLVSALALLVGCKSEPPKTGYLYVDDEEVAFVKWTQEGMRISGTIDILARKRGGEIETVQVMFDGVLDGENVSMTTKSVRTSQGDDDEQEEKITGRLRGDTLTLIRADGAEATEFRRATPEEHAEASRKLQMRATKKETAK